MQSMLFPVLFLLIVFLCQQGKADNPPTQTTGSNTRKPANSAPGSNYPKPKEQSGQTADYNLIKTPPELPDFPQYTGKCKFKGGFMYPNVQGGPTILLHFAMADAPEDVLNWYKESLKNSHWTVAEPRPNFVSGTKKGNSCVVNTSPPNCD